MFIHFSKFRPPKPFRPQDQISVTSYTYCIKCSISAISKTQIICGLGRGKGNLGQEREILKPRHQTGRIKREPSTGLQLLPDAVQAPGKRRRQRRADTAAQGEEAPLPGRTTPLGSPRLPIHSPPSPGGGRRVLRPERRCTHLFGSKTSRRRGPPKPPPEAAL